MSTARGTGYQAKECTSGVRSLVFPKTSTVMRRGPRRARRLRAVEAPHLYHTPYTSPQLELWELDDEQWRKVTARPYERRPRPADIGARQLPLPVVGLLAALIGTWVG